MAISYEDMLKLGVDQLEKGRTLSDVKADYIKLGADKSEITRALNEIQDYRAQTKAKAKREMSSVVNSEAIKTEHKKSQSEANPRTESKSSLWVYIIIFLVVAAGAAAYYLYYNGLLDFSFLSVKNIPN